MLRDFMYTLNPMVIGQALEQFNVVVPKDGYEFALIEFQVITPDSFAWRLLIDKAVYYLYAEDYVQGLEDVRNKISSYAAESVKLDFITAKIQKEFDDAEPVKNATVYEEPEAYDEMKQFAVTSGFDFVFLLKSSEDASRALFNN